jgi:hypothetical protein
MIHVLLLLDAKPLQLIVMMEVNVLMTGVALLMDVITPLMTVTITIIVQLTLVIRLKAANTHHFLMTIQTLARKMIVKKHADLFTLQ